jgi:hypothetical protein
MGQRYVTAWFFFLIAERRRFHYVSEKLLCILESVQNLHYEGYGLHQIYHPNGYAVTVERWTTDTNYKRQMKKGLLKKIENAGGVLPC